MVAITYHGHSTWEITDGDTRILMDPFFTGNGQADVAADSFDKVDAILLTHGHGDHIGDTADIAKRTGALIVSNFEIANHFGAMDLQAHPMHIGGGYQFPFGHVKLTIAHHGSSGPNGEPLGNPAGIILTIGDKKIYNAGDTALFLDMKLIAEMNGPFDVAMLPIGDNFTMGITDALKAAEFIGAKVNIPMHYNTFPIIPADPNEFKSKLEAQGQQGLVMNPGDTHEVA